MQGTHVIHILKKSNWWHMFSSGSIQLYGILEECKEGNVCLDKKAHNSDCHYMSSQDCTQLWLSYIIILICLVMKWQNSCYHYINISRQESTHLLLSYYYHKLSRQEITQLILS